VLTRRGGFERTFALAGGASERMASFVAVRRVFRRASCVAALRPVVDLFGVAGVGWACVGRRVGAPPRRASGVERVAPPARVVVPRAVEVDARWRFADVCDREPAVVPWERVAGFTVRPR
jgi:hypothetical protein